MASDELVENYGKVKLVVYDFDQTITRLHLYHCLGGGGVAELDKMSEDRLTEVFGGVERIMRLETHFKRVSKKAKMAIVSYGFVPVIKKALERVDLGEAWEGCQVIGSDSDELTKVSGAKHELIAQWRDADDALDAKTVLFVDDDPFNIRQAIRTDASLCVEISPRTGMTEEHMETIEKLVGGHPSQSILKSKKRPSITVTSPKGTESLADYRVTVPDHLRHLFDKPSDEGTPVVEITGDSPSASGDELEISFPSLGIPPTGSPSPKEAATAEC
jgi:hypothetical protein